MAPQAAPYRQPSSEPCVSAQRGRRETEAAGAVASGQSKQRPVAEGRSKLDAIPAHDSQGHGHGQGARGLESESLEDAREIMKMLRQQPRLRAQEQKQRGANAPLHDGGALELHRGVAPAATAPDGGRHAVALEGPYQPHNPPLRACGDVWADGHQQRPPSQLFDSLDLSFTRKQGENIIPSAVAEQVPQGAATARTGAVDANGHGAVAEEAAGQGTMLRQDHSSSQVPRAWEGARAPEEASEREPTLGHRVPAARPCAQVQRECLRVESVSEPSASTPATYTSLRNKQGSAPSCSRALPVGGPVEHTARWGKGAESESERKKRILREKAKAFATQCREEARRVSIRLIGDSSRRGSLRLFFMRAFLFLQTYTGGPATRREPARECEACSSATATCSGLQRGISDE